MKNSKRVILGAAAGIGALAAGVGVWMSKTERIVELIERKFDCRAEIDSVSYGLLGSPVKVSFEGLRVFPREGEGPAVLNVPRGVLEISGLLRGQPVLEGLHLEDAECYLKVTEEGKNWDMKRRSEKLSGEIAPGDADAEEGEKTEAPNDGLKSLRKVSLVRSRLIYENARKNLFAEVENLEISSENASSGDFTLAGDLGLREGESDQPFLQATLQSSVVVATSVGEPDFFIDTDILEGSSISRDLPVLRKIWDLIKQVQDFGLKIDPLPERLSLKNTKHLKCQIENDQFTLLENFAFFRSKGWEAQLSSGAQFDMETTEHRLAITLGADDERSRKLKRRFDQSIGKIPGLGRKLEESLFKDGRLSAKFRSEGEFSRPSVKSLNPIPRIKDALKGGVDDLLKGLFR